MKTVSTNKTGIGITAPAKDLEVIGVVKRIEEATYHYGDIYDDNWCSLLCRNLLKFEGKKVKITVEVLNDE